MQDILYTCHISYIEEWEVCITYMRIIISGFGIDFSVSRYTDLTK